MKLTQKLLGYLNRVFDKDPEPFLALRLQYDGESLVWTVADGLLSTVATGGIGVSLSVSLADHTLQTLADYIAAQPGYTVNDLAADRADLSAMVLMDALGDPSQPNGDHLYGYGSLLWALLEPIAVELDTARHQVALMPAEMSVGTADGYWLDELGGYYDVPRNTGETDGQYWPRIIANAVRPRSNNNAIANAIKAFTGQDVTVTDLTEWGPISPLHDASIIHNGAHEHSSAATVRYGRFDIVTGYDLINGGDPSALQATITDIVQNMRAAGTRMRTLSLSAPAAITDAGPNVIDGGYSLAGVLPLADSVTGPTEPAALAAAVATVLADSGPAVPSDVCPMSVFTNLTTDTGATLTDQSGNPLQAQIE